MEFTTPVLLIMMVSFVLFIFFLLFLYKVFSYYFFSGVGSGSGSGSGSGGNPPEKSIKLKRFPDDKEVIGKGFHRSGWPYVLGHLSSIHSSKGILFDDFVEQNFCYRSKPEIYREPWVGVFHHPPGIPYFGNYSEKLEVFTKSEEFQESAKELKFAITLSEFHAEALREIVDCPVISIPHPAKFGFREWDERSWLFNPDKRAIQLGFYLRNTQLIRQIPPIRRVNKTRLWINRPWVNEYDFRVRKYWEAENTRDEFEDFSDKYFLTPSSFDRMLSKNVVVMEFFTCSASNGVLDCIIRNTPLIVNRHPAVVEYLGEDYPLYFDDPAEIPILVGRAIEGHRYLKCMDKSFLRANNFINEIRDNI